MFERDLRMLSHVPRWVITKNIRQQTVAEHSFYVALYADQINRYFEYPAPPEDVMRAALWHDAEEIFTGDIPGPAKRSIQGDHADKWVRDQLALRFGSQVEPITNTVRLILKVANLLDEVFYKATEINMGNQAAKRGYELSSARLFESVRQLNDAMPQHQKLDLMGAVAEAMQLHLGGKENLPINDADMAPRG